MNRIKDYGKLANDITAWIKNYADTNNIQSLVVGVSGGIDSAVVSTLCAMTELPTYCYSIGIHSSEEHLQISSLHMGWLSSRYSNSVGMYIPADTIMDSFISTGSELARANTKSRLRMTILYHMAYDYNGIVVGTGNKVEDFGIGFFTKYGDGGVDISPIADLYKTEIRELGRYLGISEEIINAAPTDGLFADGRTDENQIGCTYEELEWAMEWSNEWGWGEDEDEKDHITKRQQEVLSIYRNAYKKNQHKMLPIPIFKLNQ